MAVSTSPHGGKDKGVRSSELWLTITELLP